MLNKFDHVHHHNPNFPLWSTYMSMVEILIDFIRAERDGNWKLHLQSFSAMLSWLTKYDHTNYSRCGPIYLADMHLLDKTVEFMKGNFVVKRTNCRFNQVPSDQAIQWINKLCKMHNGVIVKIRQETNSAWIPKELGFLNTLDRSSNLMIKKKSTPQIAGIVFQLEWIGTSMM